MILLRTEPKLLCVGRLVRGFFVLFCRRLSWGSWDDNGTWFDLLDVVSCFSGGGPSWRGQRRGNTNRFVDTAFVAG